MALDPRHTQPPPTRTLTVESSEAVANLRSEGEKDSWRTDCGGRCQVRV